MILNFCEVDFRELSAKVFGHIESEIRDFGIGGRCFRFRGIFDEGNQRLGMEKRLNWHGKSCGRLVGDQCASVAYKPGML